MGEETTRKWTMRTAYHERASRGLSTPRLSAARTTVAAFHDAYTCTLTTRQFRPGYGMVYYNAVSSLKERKPTWRNRTQNTIPSYSIGRHS